MGRKCLCGVICAITPLKLACFDGCQGFHGSPSCCQSGVAIDSHHGRVHMARQFTDHALWYACLAQFGYKLVSEIVESEARQTWHFRVTLLFILFRDDFAE